MQLTANDAATAPRKLPKGALGDLPLPSQWFGLLPKTGQGQIVGGPFRYIPDGYFGVCLLEHFAGAWDGVHLPIRDFGVPKQPQPVEQALLAAFNALLSGKRVWVGCMGAKGRTGLFLALMAKVVGVKDPIEYVRDIYYGHAIETAEQEAYVRDFDIGFVRSTLFWHQAWFRWFGGKLV